MRWADSYASPLRLLNASAGDSPAQQRVRRALRGGATGTVSQVLTIGCSLITVPIAVRSLGSRQFGLYFTIATALSLLGFLNFGIGNGLIAAIAGAEEHRDHAATRGLITGSAVVLGGVGALGAAVSLLVAEYVNLGPLVGAGHADADVRRAVLIALLAVFVGIPLQLSTAIRLGLQQSAVNAGWAGATGVIQLGAVATAAAMHGGLPWFVFAFISPSLITSVLNLLTLFVRRSDLRPARSALKFSVLPGLISNGGLYLVLGIAGAVAFQTDALVIAHTLGPARVTQYAIPFKVFSLPPAVVDVFFVSLWPAYSAALAAGEHAWIRRIFRRSVVASVSFNVVAALVLIFLTPMIVRIWVGPAVKVQTSMLIALAAYMIVGAVSTPVAMIMNGLHVVGPQVIGAVLMAVVNLGLSIWLCRHIGIAGPIWGTVIAQTVCSQIPYAFYLRRRLAAADLPTDHVRPAADVQPSFAETGAGLTALLGATPGQLHTEG